MSRVVALIRVGVSGLTPYLGAWSRAHVLQEPYRGYNVLGAGFDIEAGKYDGWCHWPGAPSGVFPESLKEVASVVRSLQANRDHPHWCRGVGVLVRFVEACEARSALSRKTIVSRRCHA